MGRGMESERKCRGCRRRGSSRARTPCMMSMEIQVITGSWFGFASWLKGRGGEGGGMDEEVLRKRVCFE